MMDDQIKLAVHENEIKHLQTDMDKLVKDKGGWHVLMVMGGVGAAFGGLVGWAFEHFSGK
jgi:hypothetical protein